MQSIYERCACTGGRFEPAATNRRTNELAGNPSAPPVAWRVGLGDGNDRSQHRCTRTSGRLANAEFPYTPGLASALVKRTWQTFKPHDVFPSFNLGDHFPDVSFNDPSGRVRLANMSGGCLHEIVLIHNGEIDYWPNLGYGNFGKRVTMENAPDSKSTLIPNVSSWPT